MLSAWMPLLEVAEENTFPAVEGVSRMLSQSCVTSGSCPEYWTRRLFYGLRPTVSTLWTV